jgi:orotidine-5'-phosphate decarboxylase
MEGLGKLNVDLVNVHAAGGTEKHLTYLNPP